LHVVPANKTLIRAGLEALYFTGAHLALQPLLGGIGAILTLHHVRPARTAAFQPNRLLEVTPAFLEELVLRLRRAEIDLVSPDEMHRRLTERIFWRKFVCFTFDDGYRDTRQYAYPILRRHRVPFGLYVATSFPDRLGELWWLALEAVIARNDRISLVIDDEDHHFDCRTVRKKYQVFDAIYWWLRSLPTEQALRRTMQDLCGLYRIDMTGFCADLCMTWDELAALAGDPLVTIGAHTVNHVMLRKVSDEQARSEMKMSAAVIEAALGQRPRHLAYPVGDANSAGPREFRLAREVGFITAVTSRPSVIFAEHRDHLTALPRITVNGEFQRQRYLRVLLSGAATALHNGLRRVNVA
jgi:peptidoglycan/xylan/chitin deacetylase (PgdA/CDA1 family)